MWLDNHSETRNAFAYLLRPSVRKARAMSTRVAVDVDFLNQMGEAVTAAMARGDGSIAVDTRKEALMAVFRALDECIDSTEDDHRSDVDTLISKIADCRPGSGEEVDVDDVIYTLVVKPTGAITLRSEGRPTIKFPSKDAAYRGLKDALAEHASPRMELSIDNDVMEAAFAIVAKLQASIASGRPLALRRKALKKLIVAE